MSHAATRWAMAQETGKGTSKLVLLVLADCVNAESGVMTCWPSLAHIERVTELDGKTVDAALDRLVARGLITDTKQRVGATGRVRVWRLNTPENGVISGPTPEQAIPPQFPSNPTGNGGIEIPPNFPLNPPEIPPQSPQISGSIPPKTGYGTRKEQGREPGREPGRTRALAPVIDGVPPQLVADWVEVRRAKRAGALTPSAIALLEREAAKAGVSTAIAVEACVQFGWQGFNAGWYADRVRSGRAARPFNQQEAVEAANREVADRLIARHFAENQ